MKLDGYIKSNLKSPKLTGGFYYPYNEFIYYKSNYETLIDSNKKEHYVCVGREEIPYKFNDNDFKEISDGVFYHKFLKITTGTFTFNLKDYQIVLPYYKGSLYDEISCLIFFYNDSKNKFHSYRNYRLKEMDYFPIYETVFVSGNNREIEHYVSDKVFMNENNRENVMNSVNIYTRNRLEEIGYLNMTEQQLKNYFVKRLSDKVKYVKKYKSLN
jgi:hypothetical protein